MIHIEQKFDVRAARQTVWNFLSDINRAARCTPGLEKVEPLAHGQYTVRQGMKIGPIKVTFDGVVTQVETRAPDFMRLQIDGKDLITGSKIRVSATLELFDAGAGVVTVVGTGDVDVLGALGKYGQGVADKKAAEVAGQFAAAMRSQVEQPSTPTVPPSPPAVLVKNIECLVTMDDERRVLRGAWLLTRGNLIEAIGSASDALPMAETVIDASGHLVLPGLINTHHHFFQTLLRAVPSFQNAELFPWLLELYRLMGGLTDEMMEVSTQVAVAELLLSGCTTAQDHSYLHVNDTQFDTEIKAARELGIRFHLSRGSFSIGQSKGGLPPDEIVEEDEAILADCERLVKAYHDPRPGAMVRIDIAPCSPFSVSERLMQASAELARRLKVGLHTHLAETKDEEQYCIEHYGRRPVQWMADLGWMGPDVWFAHAIQVNAAEIDWMARAGTGVAHCPSSNMRLGSGVAPVKEYLAAGVKVGLGVDGSASNDSSHLLAEARMAMLLQRVTRGADALTATEALEMATLEGAKVLGRNDIGALKVGMAADCVGFDLRQLSFAGALHDPAAALVFAAPAQASFSVINGKVALRDGQIPVLDLRELAAHHNRLAAELVKRTAAKYGHDFSTRIWRRVGPLPERAG